MDNKPFNWIIMSLLATLIICGIGILLNNISLNKTQFTIYQNECRNETSSYDGCVLGCGTGIIGSTKEYNLSEAMNICENVCSELITSVCERIEVLDNTINWCYSEDNCGKLQIGNELLELDPNWFDENCICKDEPYGVTTCTKDIPEDCFIPINYTTLNYNGYPTLSKINSSRKECLDCGQSYIFPEKCSKYSCGDYIVEVNVK